jgi:hypothetical protein
MKPRITLSVSSTGQLELFVNPEGRDELVKWLLKLDAKNEHFHLGSTEYGAELDIGMVAYGQSDRVIPTAKVMLRLDEWDHKYYPHVMVKKSIDDRF